MGGGGAPDVTLDSVAISLPADYAALLRTGRPAVLGRIKRHRCLLDLRTVNAADDKVLCQAILDVYLADQLR